MSKFVVKFHRPWHWSVAIIVLSMLLALFTWLLLDNSHWAYIRARLSGNQDDKLLWEVNRGLQNENAGLRERVLMLEQMTALDKQTAGLLQNELKTLQEDVHKLKEELEFYRGVMDASGDVNGLDVHGIHIQTLTHERSYRLKLILTHVAKTDTVVEGVIDVALEGIQKSSAQHLRLQDITLDDGLVLDFRFRNFQRFESNVILPENFKPQRVFVNLLTKNRKRSMLRKIFDWPVSVGREASNVE